MIIAFWIVCGLVGILILPFIESILDRIPLPLVIVMFLVLLFVFVKFWVVPILQ